MDERQLSFSAFARLVDATAGEDGRFKLERRRRGRLRNVEDPNRLISIAGSLQHWFAGGVQSRPLLERIAVTIGIDVEAALGLVVGKTAEELWTKQAKALGDKVAKLFKDKPHSRRPRIAGPRRARPGGPGRVIDRKTITLPSAWHQLSSLARPRGLWMR
jgi:hypothetical protein